MNDASAERKSITKLPSKFEGSFPWKNHKRMISPLFSNRMKKKCQERGVSIANLIPVAVKITTRHTVARTQKCGIRESSVLFQIFSFILQDNPPDGLNTQNTAFLNT